MNVNCRFWIIFVFCFDFKKAERVEELQQRIEKHTFHTTQLEVSYFFNIFLFVLPYCNTIINFLSLTKTILEMSDLWLLLYRFIDKKKKKSLPKIKLALFTMSMILYYKFITKIWVASCNIVEKAEAEECFRKNTLSFWQEWIFTCFLLPFQHILRLLDNETIEVDEVSWHIFIIFLTLILTGMIN